MMGNSVLLPQSVLGALIAVNLKNSLKQLADPYYLWKKSKLDCVSSRRPWVPVMPGTPGTAAPQAWHFCQWSLWSVAP